MFKYGGHVVEVVGVKCKPIQSVEDVEFLLSNIERLSTARNVVTQLFDARYIAGRKHALLSALFALDTLKHGRRHAKKLNIEMLVYASTQKQISTAIKTVGVRVGTSEIVAVCIGGDEGSVNDVLSQVLVMLSGVRDDSILELNEDKVKELIDFYNVSLKEYEIVKSVSGDSGEALVKILVNRMALLPYA